MDLGVLWGSSGSGSERLQASGKLRKSIYRSNLSSLLGVPVRELAAARSSRSCTHRYLSFPVVWSVLFKGMQRIMLLCQRAVLPWSLPWIEEFENSFAVPPSYRSYSLIVVLKPVQLEGTSCNRRLCLHAQAWFETGMQLTLSQTGRHRQTHSYSSGPLFLRGRLLSKQAQSSRRWYLSSRRHVFRCYFRMNFKRLQPRAPIIQHVEKIWLKTNILWESVRKSSETLQSLLKLLDDLHLERHGAAQVLKAKLLATDIDQEAEANAQILPSAAVCMTYAYEYGIIYIILYIDVTYNSYMCSGNTR